jgi:hypothetical protein
VGCARGSERSNSTSVCEKRPINGITFLYLNGFISPLYDRIQIVHSRAFIVESFYNFDLTQQK